MRWHDTAIETKAILRLCHIDPPCFPSCSNQPKLLGDYAHAKPTRRLRCAEPLQQVRRQVAAAFG
jgi:hypothetical protein